MTIADLLEDIQTLDEELRAYERKYGVLSETLYEAYSAGEEPPSDSCVQDWAAWASAYELWLYRHQQYRTALDAFRAQGHSTADVIDKAARHDPIPVPA